MKKKFISLGMAVMMLLGVTGCAMKTPATAGTIGGVEIPAGIYLLAQYNAYNAAASAATLATGETASDVKAVLKAECTGTIGDEEVTTNGKDYTARLTLRSLQYYAAVEAKFDELGGSLDDAATAEAAASADSMWESNGDLYTANGISKTSVERYLLNSQKAQACLDLLYGDAGANPVSETEYTDYVNGNCYFIDSMQLPLLDYSTYAFADETQKATIDGYADESIAMLDSYATAETAASDVYTSLYITAMNYLPSAFEALGSTLDTNQLTYYIGSQLYTPADLTNFDNADGTNTLTSALDAVGYGKWTKVDLGTSILVLRQDNALESYTLDELKSNFGLLDAMKSEDLQKDLYAQGASMEQNLNQSAMNTYSASKIKKSV